MADNLDEFRIELRKFGDGIPEQAGAYQRKVTLEGLRRLVLRSPVGNPELWAATREARAAGRKPPIPAGYVGGHFRHNWQVTQDTPAGSVLQGVDPSGAGVLARGAQAVAALQPFSVSEIVNNVVYGEALEHGHSTQAPEGMLAITVAELSVLGVPE